MTPESVLGFGRQGLEILLFVLVDGWVLAVGTLAASFNAV